jgi:hypothetical protein
MLEHGETSFSQEDGGLVRVSLQVPRARKGIAMESTMDEGEIRIDTAAKLSGAVLQRVRGRLSQSCHFTRHWREINCEYREGVLILRGRLPTFYLKQVLQSILKDLLGVRRVDNRVDVVSAAGLSSIRRS